MRKTQEAGAEALDAAAPGDFYELLGLDFDDGVSAAAVRAAHRALAKHAHPDVVGPCATELQALMNRAAATLTDAALREAYDAELTAHRRATGGSYTGTPESGWAGPPGETRAVFVDECDCIGCAFCMHAAPNVFQEEPEYGRARVKTQWADGQEAIDEAIEACPVSCIHVVRRKDLALLEFVMKACEREDIAIMARRRSGNMGSGPSGNGPFARAEVFLRQRQEVRVDADGSNLGAEELAAAIARAWLALPQAARAKGWPTWGAEVPEGA